jgi:excisionase family DNA binding protein
MSDTTTIPISEHQYYTPDQVADLLCVNRATIYRWIQRGILPAVKLSNNVRRIPTSALENLSPKVTR